MGVDAEKNSIIMPYEQRNGKHNVIKIKLDYSV